MSEPITAGQDVMVRDAWGKDHPAVADSGLEGAWAKRDDGRMYRVHDFPVIWVRMCHDRGLGERVPWPAVDVVPIVGPDNRG